MIKFLDLHAQYETIATEIDQAIASAIRRAAFIGGEDVAAFEREFAAFQQVEHCIGVANGTDAIEILLEAFAFPAGSEVIVPANSFIATSEAVTRMGHRVVFADVEPSTYTLDPEDVRRRITPRTRAIIAVHLYGQPCDMSALRAIAEEHGLKLIEDAAQAHGAEYGGRRVGGLGDGATFSFYPGKNLGAYGDAGAITTQDAAIALKCRMIANHGRTGKYDHRFEGRNSRLDGLQAAILRVKLAHLPEWLEQRRRVAAAYGEALSGIKGIELPITAAGRLHAYHLYVIRTDRRDELAAHLQQAGIQTGIHYPIALPKLAAYAYLNQADAPLFANRADSTLLSLPIGEHLTEEDARTVASTIRTFLGTR